MTRRTSRTRRSAGAAAAAALVLLAAACGSADDGDTPASADDNPNNSSTDTADDTVEIDEAALQATFDSWRADTGPFGATLSIRVPGHDDIHLASGIDDRDPDTPMPTDGTYYTGAVTKTFVAAAALQLVDEGRLSLDEPVEPWLPELPNADQITLAMLLGQTSGLGPYWFGPDAFVAAAAGNDEPIVDELTRSITPDELLAGTQLAGTRDIPGTLDVPPAQPPGQGFVDSHANDQLVGTIVERELDQDLATVIAERFTEPLSLDDTRHSDGSTKPTRHMWFSPDGDPRRAVDLLAVPHEALATSAWATEAVISSSADLLDWGDALYSGDLLGPEATTRMLEMHEAADPYPSYGLATTGYCLHAAPCTTDDIDLVGHRSRAPGTSVWLVHHPESETTIVVHANWPEFETAEHLIPLAADVLAELRIAQP
jgi:D-alanyl-D-alanine carboxypeptidase